MSRRKQLPTFRTPEEEAEFWETHSPLDYGMLRFRPLEIRAPKDRPISIRLTTEYSQKLAEAARLRRVGPSTLARTLLEALLDNPSQLQLLLVSSLIPKDRYASLPGQVKEVVERLTKETKSSGSSEGREFLVIPVEHLTDALTASVQALLEGLKVAAPSSQEGGRK